MCVYIVLLFFGIFLDVVVLFFFRFNLLIIKLVFLFVIKYRFGCYDKIFVLIEV